MGPTINRFLDAAIATRLAHHAHLKASRAALEATKDGEEAAIRARQMTACGCVDADTEFDMAFKLITDPYIP